MSEEKKSKDPDKNNHRGLKIFLFILLVLFLLMLTSGISSFGVYWWQKGVKNNIKSDCEKNENVLKDSINNQKAKLDQCEDEREDLNKQLSDIKNIVSDSEEGSEEGDQTAGVNPCEFNKEVALKTTTTYGIFGDDEFDTVVCGYAELKDEVVFDETQTNIYFNIAKFVDEEFKDSLQQGISEGNTINQQEGEIYKFNLGCYKNDAIEGIQYEDGVDYIDSATQQAILNSTAENPVALILSFGEHYGRGCDCCNLAHQIKLY